MYQTKDLVYLYTHSTLEINMIIKLTNSSSDWLESLQYLVSWCSSWQLFFSCFLLSLQPSSIYEVPALSWSLFIATSDMSSSSSLQYCGDQSSSTSKENSFEHASAKVLWQNNYSFEEIMLKFYWDPVERSQHANEQRFKKLITYIINLFTFICE